MGARGQREFFSCLNGGLRNLEGHDGGKKLQMDTNMSDTVTGHVLAFWIALFFFEVSCGRGERLVHG